MNCWPLFAEAETAKLAAPKDMIDPKELDDAFRNLIIPA